MRLHPKKSGYHAIIAEIDVIVKRKTVNPVNAKLLPGFNR
jgi:hypothetical protein